MTTKTSDPSLEALMAYYLHYHTKADYDVACVRQASQQLRQKIEAHQPAMAQTPERLMARLPK